MSKWLERLHAATETPTRGTNKTHETPATDDDSGPGWRNADIARFYVRTTHFQLTHNRREDVADFIAERLHLRDRDLDTRRLCLECAGLVNGTCKNWRAAGFHRADATPVIRFQRCPGFAIHPTLAAVEPQS
jgi:hypothetical protein